MIIAVLLLACISSIIYGFFIIDIWAKARTYMAITPPFDYSPSLHISVIIPVKNEEKTIAKTIESILLNSFPSNQLEIIVINDHSDDRTLSILENIHGAPLTIINLEDHIDKNKKYNSYKKEALKVALNLANGELIMQTDGDCRVSSNWLQQTAYNFEERGVKFQTGRIAFLGGDSFLEQFQRFDMNVMMELTKVGIITGRWYLANGANMAYLRSELPQELYKESKKIASGDDVFLVNEMAQRVQMLSEIHFEENVLIETEPMYTFQSFIQQRIRWAGKNKILMKNAMSNVLVIPALYNGFLIFLLLLGIINPYVWLILFCSLMIKASIDCLLIFIFKSHASLPPIWTYITSSLLFPFYMVGIGMYSFVAKSYKWKGRNVS